MKQHYKIILITILAAILRFVDLGKNGLWIDESLTAFFIKHKDFSQEQLPVLIGQIFGYGSEFWLRFPSALCGVLSVPAIYYIAKNHKLEAALFVALFPIFVFWSRLNRPYAMAGLFIILSWRWWWMLLPALLCTPISLLGLKIIKQKKYVIALFIILAIGFYFLREDSGRNWTFQQVLYSPRWFYIPALTLILYLTEFKFKMTIPKRIIFVGLMAFFFFTSIDLKGWQWYSRECNFSNWRSVPAVDYSTNAVVSNWYSNGHSKYFRYENMREFFLRKDTVTLGLDYYSLYPISGNFLPFLRKPEFKYMREQLANGKVFVFRVYKGQIFL